MTPVKLVVALLSATSAAKAHGEAPRLPWEENRPIAKARKGVYRRHPSEAVAAWVIVRYVGPGLEREEVYLTRLGVTPKDFRGADAYKYTLILK